MKIIPKNIIESTNVVYNTLLLNFKFNRVVSIESNNVAKISEFENKPTLIFFHSLSKTFI